MTERQDSPSLEPNLSSTNQNHNGQRKADSPNIEPESPKSITVPPKNSIVAPKKTPNF